MRHSEHTQPPERKPGWPDSEDDVINKYGTYEIQETADTDNRYPLIAQGMPEKAKKAFRDSRPSRNSKKRGEENIHPLPPGEL